MDNGQPRRARRHSFVGPLILIVVGALFLLSNLGLLTWGFWDTMWRFWPVILVLIGIEVLFGRTWPLLGGILAVVVLASVLILSAAMSGGFVQPVAAGPAGGERIVEEAGSLTSAKVELDFGAGSMAVGSLQGDSANLAEVDITRGSGGTSVDRRFSRSNGEGNLVLKSKGPSSLPLGPGGGDSWDVRLNQTLPLSLRIKTGASRSSLDLTDLTVADLRIDVGASTLELKLPRAGSTKATVKAGAATVKIEIPPTMAARIRAKGGLSAMEVDQERFPRSGDYYVSSNWDSATDRVELDVEGGVASVTVR